MPQAVCSKKIQTNIFSLVLLKASFLFLGLTIQGLVGLIFHFFLSFLSKSKFGMAVFQRISRYTVFGNSTTLRIGDVLKQKIGGSKRDDMTVDLWLASVCFEQLFGSSELCF